MKKNIILSVLIMLVLFLPSFVNSASINANTNLASGKSSYGTFSYATYATDGKIKGVQAISSTISDSPQYLTIDLGLNTYLDRVKIYWDKDALSNNFIVRTSSDAKYWYDEAKGLDASFGVADPDSGTKALNISLTRAINSSRYVQIMIPAGTKVTNSKGDYVKISEVEVFPSVNQKFTITKIDPYAITDNTCIIMYKTSIGAASGTVLYGTDQQKLTTTARNADSGVDNSVVLGSLKPRTTYFYEIRTTDHNGNGTTSKVGQFTTLSDNIALNKKVTGTFVNYPAFDKYVKPGNDQEILTRVTDGSTSYFTSMATSGPVPSSDQYVIIDLGSSYTIKNVISYWRKLAYPENMIVQVSDNNTDWKTIATSVNAAKGAFARSDTGDPMQVVNIKGDAGRYVKLLIKKGSPYFTKHTTWDYVQLMEVKVFAE